MLQRNKGEQEFLILSNDGNRVQIQRAARVSRDPAAKFVRDLATMSPPKELTMLKAASDAAERDRHTNVRSDGDKRASRQP